MQTRQTFPYFLLALVVIAAWGFSNIATKFLYAHGMGPYAVLALRTLIAYGILVALAHGRIFADSIRDELRFVLLGILCVPIYSGLENLALTQANAGTVAAIMAAAPLLTALIVILRWRNFRLHWMTKLGIWTATTGLILVAFDDLVMQGLSATGFALALGAALAWAVFTALLKSVHSYDPRFVARKTMGWGMIAVIPFFLMEDPTDAMLLTDPKLAATLLFLAAGGYLLGESMSFVGIMGTLMMLCGVWSADLGMKRVSAVLAGADPKLLSAKISY